MEEDTKILEQLLNTKISFTLSPTDEGYKIIENLLKAYKEKEVERKWYMEIISKLSFELGKYQAKSEEDEAVIEKQQKEIEEKNIAINKQSITISKQLQEIERFNNEMDLDYVDNNFVSKKKIQDKIDELNKQIEELKKNAFSKGLDEVEFDFWKSELNKAIAKRNVLQELLESEE